MARTHVWKFLVNQAGEPIEDAQIYVTLAGTDDAAWVYFDEFSASGTRTTSDIIGQTTSLENGYFEFWIDENTEFDVDDIINDNPEGTAYGFNQKFKIRWQKSGVANGYVDYVDVFPANRFFQKFDSTRCEDTTLNKLVSNNMVCNWNTHINWTIIDDGLPIHGLEYVQVQFQDEVQNKIISNSLGWLWTSHQESTLQNYASLGCPNPPHDLQPVDWTSEDTTFNKVVSNKILYDLRQSAKSRIMTIKVIGQPADANWNTNSDGVYEATLTHDLDIEFPDVTCYILDDGEQKLVRTAEVVYVGINSITIRIDEANVDMTVRITT